ncbi:MAG: hypothetical protein CL678_00440 [Bdellovibrionaceae bacterium]|nr:hypothetical protein [Pseudobdellovibrionaceae bacterium]|tara:strand:- start:2533 stop:4194 length:1662 start_codon:yes stop_codon:yes gene_type:complete
MADAAGGDEAAKAAQQVLKTAQVLQANLPTPKKLLTRDVQVAQSMTQISQILSQYEIIGTKFVMKGVNVDEENTIVPYDNNELLAVVKDNSSNVFSIFYGDTKGMTIGSLFLKGAPLRKTDIDGAQYDVIKEKNPSTRFQDLKFDFTFTSAGDTGIALVCGGSFQKRDLETPPDIFSLDIMQSFTDLTDELIQELNLGPLPPVRAHLYRMANEDEDNANAEISRVHLSHEIRDHAHSKEWWINKIKRVSAAYKKFADKTPDISSDLVKGARAELQTLSVEDIGQVSKACRGWFTSSIAAGGAILNAGIKTNIIPPSIRGDLLAEKLSFLGCSDPAADDAVSIPQMLLVVARDASVVPRGVLGGGLTATLMQCETWKKLTARGNMYVSQLRTRVRSLERGRKRARAGEAAELFEAQPAATDANEIVEAIAQAVFRMHDVTQKYAVTKRSMPHPDEVVRQGMAFLLRYTDQEHIDSLLALLGPPESRAQPFDNDFVSLRPVLSADRQSDLDLIVSREDIPTIELFESKSWVYGNAINDEYLMAEMYAHGISATTT